MSAAAVLKWAAAEGVRLEVKQGRIVWHADHQPPADLLERLSAQRHEIIDTIAKQYRDAIAQAAGVPFDWLAAHYFTADDMTDMEAGLYPDPVALGELIRTQAPFPNAWSARICPRQSTALSLYAPTTLPTSATPANSLAELTAQGLALAGDDWIYIRHHLAGMTTEQRQNILAAYAAQWLTAMEGLPEHQQQNAGRFAANCWLRASVRQM